MVTQEYGQKMNRLQDELQEKLEMIERGQALFEDMQEHIQNLEDDNAQIIMEGDVPPTPSSPQQFGNMSPSGSGYTGLQLGSPKDQLKLNPDLDSLKSTNYG